MTPQQLRDTIKTQYSEFYGTESHRRNVQRGHYQSTEHALLSQIYVAGKTAGIVADRSQKPMKLFLGADTVDDDVSQGGVIETENSDKLEVSIGPMYVLGTNLYTKDGQEIIKIGVTTGAEYVTRPCGTSKPRNSGARGGASCEDKHLNSGSCAPFVRHSC
jgi:hypothetical protein